MPGLDSLLPEYRAQYESLMPEIERKVRSGLQRRGMTNSGEATDALARAEAELLAELGGKSATTRASQEEAQRQRQYAASEGDANRKEAARAQRLGLLGSAVGGLGTLGAMYAMRPGANANINIVPKGDGTFLAFDERTGQMRPISEAGAGGMTAPGSGVMAPGAAPAPSMWQKAGGFGRLAAGAGGGLVGSQLSSLIAGRDTGTMGAAGSALGGLGGYMAGMRYGGGSPWAAGLGALLGAGGGGLLGNLFK